MGLEFDKFLLVEYRPESIIIYATIKVKMEVAMILLSHRKQPENLLIFQASWFRIGLMSVYQERKMPWSLVLCLFKLLGGVLLEHWQLFSII